MNPHNSPDKYTEFKKFDGADCLTVSAGLNGIVDLKGFELNSRYSGSKKYTIFSDGTAAKKFSKKSKKPAEKKLQQKKFYTVKSKEIKHRISNWINQQAGQKTLYFYTISFPVLIPDDTAYTALNSWLTTLRKTYKLRNYLWIAERQKNSTIHFHIAIQEYLPIKKVNAVMKNLIHHYIRKQKIDWTHSAASKYNGVDIAKDRKTKRVTNFAKGTVAKNLSLYLTKYITKSQVPFQRQAWQCSRNLSAMVIKLNFTASEFLNSFLNYIDIDNPTFDNEFCTYYSWKTSPPKAISQALATANQTILSANFDDFLYDCDRHHFQNHINLKIKQFDAIGIQKR